MAEKYLKQFQIFFNKAKKDLAASKYLYKGFNEDNIDLDVEIIMFHIQQSCEKLLKTVLDYNKIKFPRTHDIEELINLLTSNGINLILNNDMLIELSDYAVEGRYSIIHDDLNNIESYLKLLDDLFDKVSNIVVL